MSQYRTGTVSLVNGSAIVTGIATAFLANVAAGNAFNKRNEGVVYQIASVDTDLQVTLSTPYAGVTDPAAQFVISTDFTPNLSLTEINQADVDWPTHLTLTLRAIDAYIASCKLAKNYDTIFFTAAIASAAANFKGAWSALTGSAAIPYSVSHLGRYWMLITASSNITLDVPGTSAKWQEIGNVPLTDFNAAVNPKAMSQGVAMTYATGGSLGIQVADNDNIDFGTGNFTLVWKGALPDWTPSDTAGAQILMTKYQGSADRWLLYINRTAYNYNIQFDARKTDVTSIAAISTKGALPVIDGATVEILAVITRETVDTAGSVAFYVNGVLWDTVTIPAGTPADISNTGSVTVAGNPMSGVRYASTIQSAITFNRALTAAEVLDLYRNGINYADKWGSQTAVYTSDFSAGVDSWTGFNANVSVTGNVDSIDGEDDWLKIERINTVGYNYISRSTGFTAYKHNSISFKIYNNAASGFTHFAGYKGSGNRASGVVAIAEGTSGTLTMSHIETSELASSVAMYISPCNATGTMVANAAVGSLWYIKNINAYNSGATLCLLPENAQPSPGQWIDESTNKLHAQLPAVGASLTRPKKDFEFRCTNTWTASSAAQYLTGFNQVVMTADHFITDIITQATVTTDVENLTLGDGSDADRFVTAFAPSATRTKQTVAAQNDGTNLKLVYTPAAEATMTVETIIRGFIWEP